MAKSNFQEMQDRILKLRRESGMTLDEIAAEMGLKNRQSVKYYLPKIAGACRCCQRPFPKRKNEKRLQSAARVSAK